jgi:hypothetical protein
MEDQGFVRYIVGNSSSKDRLPTAEYNMPDTNLARADVLKRAKAAANSVKPDPAPWSPRHRISRPIMVRSETMARLV